MASLHPESLPVTYRGYIDPHTHGHDGRSPAPTHAHRFEAASWQLLALLGMGPQRLSAARLRVVRVEERVSVAPVGGGIALHVESEVLEVGPTTLEYRHTLLDTETGWSFATMRRRIALVGDGGQPVAIPAVARRRARFFFKAVACYAGKRDLAVAA